MSIYYLFSRKQRLKDNHGYRENPGTEDYAFVVVNWTPRSPSFMKTDNPFYEVLMVDGNEEINLKVSQSN